jgi:hypothetical protein
MPSWRRRVEFVYDYGQLYLHDACRRWSADYAEYLAALDHARERNLSVGIAAGVVDILMPRQENFAAPLQIEGNDSIPLCDVESWDHVIEFPLVIESGALMLSASGGSGDTNVSVPAAAYRARWAGRNFAGAEAWGYSDHEAENPPDEYRLQLWPDPDQSDPVELKLWPAPRMRG